MSLEKDEKNVKTSNSDNSEALTDPADIIPRTFKSVEITTTKIETQKETPKEIQKYNETSFDNSDQKVIEENLTEAK